MKAKFVDMTSLLVFFDVVVFLLSILVASPSFMSISRLVLESLFLYKRLNRNPEIGNAVVWVLPNIQRLGQVRDTSFDTIVSDKMLSHVAKCNGYSFYRFWVIKGKPTGGKIIPSSTQIRVKVWNFVIFDQCETHDQL